MVYLDLDEISTVFKRRWLWSATGFNIAWFRRSDHLGDPEKNLSDEVRNLVEKDTGTRPEGAIGLLTHLRYFGYAMNPVSFFYCFERNSDRLQAIVAEVNNTPWGERHVYVLSIDPERCNDKLFKLGSQKDFHVSPFMPMDMEYNWRISPPQKKLNVHIENKQDNAKVFDATLRMDGRSLSRRNMAAALIRFPLVTLKIAAAIYFEAVRLWLKKTPIHDHPDSTKTS